MKKAYKFFTIRFSQLSIDNFGPPYCIHYFKFEKSNIKFRISDRRNLSVTNFIQMLFTYFGSAILDAPF